MTIRYGCHHVTQEDIEAVVGVLNGDWLTTGPAVADFELALSALVGGAPVASVSSGTAALHCAYRSLDLKHGDEVIVPAITFASTITMLLHLGAHPVIADVEGDTANLDPKAVEECLSPRTRAVVAVDYAGHPAEMDILAELCSRNGLHLIEDASHSLGSQFRGRPVGGLADITTFSFFPTKNITTGEGGAIAAQSPDLLRSAQLFARQGLVRDGSSLKLPDEGRWHQEVQMLGFNYRLSDINAALGLSQLSRLEQSKRSREAIKQRYDEAFAELQAVRVPAKRDYVDVFWHLYPLRVPAEIRKTIFDDLHGQGILVQVNYIPVQRHPAISDLVRVAEETPQADHFYAGEISLPMHTQLAPIDQEQVIDAVVSSLERHGGL